MTRFLREAVDIIALTLPYWGLFLAAFVLSLVLVPLVREMNRFFGMVDAPSARRINKTPIPRGGGLAVIVSCTVVSSLFVLFSKKAISPAYAAETFWRLTALAVTTGALGYADDKFGLRPIVKLSGQLIVAALVHFWGGLGFATFFPAIPGWLDAVLTIFWITGAINAFNLIDGLDGLASGLAVIAAAGMAGALFFIGSPAQTLLHFVFIGALIGFLRYNFNPASVFLGDSGSMYIGFMLATLPLSTRAGDSFLVGVGVPVLAMGVPIFDTSLAILRRTVRRVLSRNEHGANEGNGRVMTADTDHLHHRLLRHFASQRKAAWALYAMAAALVLTGLGAVMWRDRAAALFIVAFVVGAVVVVRDMSRVELWDTGRLLENVARDHSVRSRRRAAFLVPIYVVADVAILFASWAFSVIVQDGVSFRANSFHTYLPLRVIPSFLALVFFRAYATVWGRAQISNYIRLFLALLAGTAVSAAAMVALGLPHHGFFPVSIMFVLMSFFGIAALRLARNILRDFFYTLATIRMRDDPDAVRTLVFGAGLRYRSFRRELVRRAANGHRYICGIVDDDIVLRGHYIGGVQVDGPHTDAKRIVRRTGADEVVIAADIPPERLALIVKAFKDCGVKVKQFTFEEKEL